LSRFRNTTGNPQDAECVCNRRARGNRRNRRNATAKETLALAEKDQGTRSRESEGDYSWGCGTGVRKRGEERKRGGRAALHPRSYYNRSSEPLLKRVYTGLGVDSGRAHPPSRPLSTVPSSADPWFQPTRSFVVPPHTHTYTHIYIHTHTHTRAHWGVLCVRSNAYLIVACMNSESRSTRGYEPDPS